MLGDLQRSKRWRINIIVKCRIVDVLLNISASSDCRRMRPTPLDAARRGGSNEVRCILLQSLDAEIINEISFLIFLIEKSVNNSVISFYRLPIPNYRYRSVIYRIYQFGNF